MQMQTPVEPGPLSDPTKPFSVLTWWPQSTAWDTVHCSLGAAGCGESSCPQSTRGLVPCTLLEGLAQLQGQEKASASLWSPHAGCGDRMGPICPFTDGGEEQVRGAGHGPSLRLDLKTKAVDTNTPQSLSHEPLAAFPW
jgi:hypothetical protein